MSKLKSGDIDQIFKQGDGAANAIASGDGLRSSAATGKRATKMHIAIVDRDGKFVKMHSMEDAWEGSRDIAIAKARTAAFFSSNENALTSRIIGDLSQPGQTLWGIGASNQVGATGDKEHRNGIITFPGGVPLYKDGILVGGVGVSGDGVDQDEAVAFAAAAGFEPGDNTVKLGMEPKSVEKV